MGMGKTEAAAVFQARASWAGSGSARDETNAPTDKRTDFREAVSVARLGIIPGHAHALAAAAGRGLDHDRVADVVGDLQCVVDILQTSDGAVKAGILGQDAEEHCGTTLPQTPMLPLEATK